MRVVGDEFPIRIHEIDVARMIDRIIRVLYAAIDMRPIIDAVGVGGLGNLVSAMKANKTDATLILPPLGEQMLPSGQKRLAAVRLMMTAERPPISSALNARPSINGIPSTLK